jgi:SMC interacting uncharacterized protein involved in chromosome segregation
MKREEIENLMEQIEDMKNQVDNMYFDAMSARDDFEEYSSEWDKCDRAMDMIRDAVNSLESAIDELH